jgi:hypothetical protein
MQENRDIPASPHTMQCGTWSGCDGMIKKVFCVGLMDVAVGFLTFTSCQFQESSHASWYTDPQFGFRIASPDSGWIQTDETGIQGLLVIIKSKTMTEDFTPNVTVAVEVLPCMMTAFEYGEKNQKSLTIQGYDVFSWKMSVINQIAFFDLQCVNRRVSPALRFRHLCLVKNRLGFVVTCTAPEKQDEKLNKDFDFIVDSFRLL